MDMKSESTSEEVDIIYLYDSLLVCEEQFVASGYEEGFARGEQIGFQEGYDLGRQKGSEIGSEIAFYRGFAKGWISLLSSSSSYSENITELLTNCTSLDSIVSQEIKTLLCVNANSSSSHLQSESELKTVK